MTDFRIRPAAAADLEALDARLTSLSREIGDPHPATIENLRAGLFGPAAFVHAFVAEGEARLAAVALFTPVFSTARGGAGVYLSDIWVEQATRGSGLGLRLLKAVSEAARARWGAHFLRLAVHDDNAAARRFYEKQGFTAVVGETVMVMDGPAFEKFWRQA